MFLEEDVIMPDYTHYILIIDNCIDIGRPIVPPTQEGSTPERVVIYHILGKMLEISRKFSPG